MSLLDRLFGGLFGEEEEQQEIEHPCSNCPSTCTIAPKACAVCQPYKEKMIDAIYRVEHKDEIISQYEVVGTSASEGTVICPNCGGHSENHYVCDYCGSKLQDGSGKIQVASAADIPNPVLEAQDIIFSRYEAVKGYASADSGYGYEDALSGIGSQGLFSSIFSALLGDDDSSLSESASIGKKMTEGEIEEMAKYYNVSVSDYLTGLDNGKYLTLSNKSAAAKAEETYARKQSSSQGSSMGDLAGLAGALGLGSMLFGGSTYNHSAAKKPYNYTNMGSSHYQQAGMGGVPHQQMGASHYQQKPAQQADPRLNNAGKMSAQMAKEEKKLQEARRQAEEKKAQEARRAQQEKAAFEAKRAQEEKKAQEAARKKAAMTGSDARLNNGLGNVHSAASVRKEAQRDAVREKSGKVESFKDFSKKQSADKSTGDKAPGGAAGMGRRPGR